MLLIDSKYWGHWGDGAVLVFELGVSLHLLSSLSTTWATPQDQSFSYTFFFGFSYFSYFSRKVSCFCPGPAFSDLPTYTLPGSWDYRCKKMSLPNFLLGMALHHDPSDLCLPSNALWQTLNVFTTFKIVVWLLTCKNLHSPFYYLFSACFCFAFPDFFWVKYFKISI
jgi:hypothetical protein